MRDPDITFEYNRHEGYIIPLSYQNDYMSIYRETFSTDENGKPLYKKQELTGNDDFMYIWLNNIESQGFTPAIFEAIA